MQHFPFYFDRMNNRNRYWLLCTGSFTKFARILRRFCKDEIKCKETLLITHVYYVCVQTKVRIVEIGSNQLYYCNTLVDCLYFLYIYIDTAPVSTIRTFICTYTQYTCIIKRVSLHFIQSLQYLRKTQANFVNDPVCRIIILNLD